MLPKKHKSGALDSALEDFASRNAQRQFLKKHYSFI
jgi:hypothetical protein